MGKSELAVFFVLAILVLLLVLRRVLKARRRMRLFGETFREAMRKPNPIRNKVDLSDNKPTDEARRKTERLKSRYKTKDDYDPWDDEH